MTTIDLTTAADGASPASDTPGDPTAEVRALAAENAARVRRLRGAQIPQHVGMAAACRALAVELPRALTVQIDSDLASGVLAQRWEAVRAAAAEPGASGELDSTLFAIALLLREQSRAVMRQLVRREKEWTADAYRLEGQASALEDVAAQLGRVAGGPAGADAAGAGSDAQAPVAIGSDAASANARGAIER
jgi:hypothetical protein